jgi:hypothetical protein
MGKWYFYKTTENINGQEEVIFYENECSSKKDYIEFLENNLNSVIHNVNCEVEFSDNEIYSISGSNLIIGLGTNEDIFEIITLNNNTLQLKGVTDIVDGNGNIITTETFIIEFKR